MSYGSSKVSSSGSSSFLSGSGSSGRSTGSNPSSSQSDGSSCNKPEVVNVFWERNAGIYSGGATLNAFGKYVASSGDFINIDWKPALNRWEMWDGGGFTIAIKNGDPCDPTGIYTPIDPDVLNAEVTT
jgi:hypothetical protein